MKFHLDKIDLYNDNGVKITIHWRKFAKRIDLVTDRYDISMYYDQWRGLTVFDKYTCRIILNINALTSLSLFVKMEDKKKVLYSSAEMVDAKIQKLLKLRAFS